MKHKLTDINVKAILWEDTDAETIAAQFGCSAQTVFLIKRLGSKMAKRCAEEMKAEGQRVVTWPAPARRKRLTAEQVAAIKASTKSSGAVAKELGCSASMVRMIRTGKVHS